MHAPESNNENHSTFAAKAIALDGGGMGACAPTSDRGRNFDLAQSGPQHSAT